MKNQLRKILIVLTLIAFTVTGCSSNKSNNTVQNSNDNKES